MKFSDHRYIEDVFVDQTTSSIEDITRDITVGTIADDFASTSAKSSQNPQ